LQILTNDAQAGMLLAALFIFPGVTVEPAFDEHRAAFFEVLQGDFAQALP
jgi:hypothetical protein